MPSETGEPQRSPLLGGVVEGQYVWFGVLSPDNDFTVERVILHAYQLGDGLRQAPDYISSFSACGKPRWLGTIVSGDPRCPDCAALAVAARPAECDFNVHDDPRWCDTHEARWPDPTKPCEAAAHPADGEAGLRAALERWFPDGWVRVDMTIAAFVKGVESWSDAALAAKPETGSCSECGHDDSEHVHYCSHDDENGSCECNAEYVRS